MWMVKLDDILDELMVMVDEQVGALPYSSEESEEFFNSIVENFNGTPKECLHYIKSHLKEWFPSASGRPGWLQNPEWPFFEGKPMTFIGQIYLARGTSGWPMDDGCFFVFYSPDSGVTETIVQIF
jgi:hypothetical protein